MNSRSTTPAAPILPLLSEEISHAVFELRFMIIFMIILTLADMWWALRENRYRRDKALSLGDATTAELYRFRASRAGRRTANKIVDYTTYLLVGAFIGYAVLEPLGIADHVASAAVGILLGCVFDISSIIGHVFAVRGYRWDGRKFVVALLNLKKPELGAAVEEAVEVSLKKDTDHDNTTN